jgi:hypothetical protein
VSGSCGPTSATSPASARAGSASSGRAAVVQSCSSTNNPHLLETFKPRAIERGWLWATADLSESASISETALAERLLADLALITSSLTVVDPGLKPPVGFAATPEPKEVPLTHEVLVGIYQRTPGLTADKIKATLEFAWERFGAEANTG